MKKIFLLLLLFTNMYVFADKDWFDPEYIVKNQSYSFEAQDFEYDLNNDAKVDSIKFDQKEKNAITINGKKFTFEHIDSISNFYLTPTKDKLYIGLAYTTTDYNSYVKVFTYDGDKLNGIEPKNEKLEKEIQTEIDRINLEISKKKEFDYFKHFRVKPVDCESSTYEVAYNKSHEIISITHSSLSQTGESGSIETQFYDKGKFVFITLECWGMYDGTSVAKAKVLNNKINEYSFMADNELEIVFDKGKLFEDQHLTTLFLKNGKFVMPKDEN